MRALSYHLFLSIFILSIAYCGNKQCERDHAFRMRAATPERGER